jgi:hypothetical protein
MSRVGRNAGTIILMLVLFWHEWWRQRRKADALVFSVLETWIERTAHRGVAAAGGGNSRRRHQAYGFLGDSTFPGSKIGRAAALRLAICAGGDGLFGPFRQLGILGQPIGARDATWTIIFSECLDPKMNGAGLAFERMRFHYAGLQQFESRRQWITR